MDCYLLNLEELNPATFIRFQGLLSPDEKKRLLAMKSVRRQNQFLAGRALLKNIGARLFKKSPEKIEIAVSESGALSFVKYPKTYITLAHSGKYVVAVIAPFPVGVDIEYIKEKDYPPLMERLFPRFLPGFDALQPAHQQKMFYTLFTQYEAEYKLKSVSPRATPVFILKSFENHMMAVATGQSSDMHTYIARPVGLGWEFISG